MRIIQISPFYHPVLGGVEAVVKSYSERLVQKGHLVRVLTSNLGDATEEIINGVKIKRYFSLPLPKNLPYMPITPLLPFSVINQKADIWHLHANKRFITDSCALVLSLRSQGFIFNPYAGQFGTTALGQIHNKTLGKLSLGAKRIICISEYEKSLLEKNGLPGEKVVVLPVGVDLKEFEGMKKDFFKRVNWEKNKVIMFAGRLVPHKNVDILIKALGRLKPKIPEAKLAIVGPDGGEKLKLSLLVKQEGLAEEVRFFGSLERRELLMALASASVFCLPSSSESFGLVLVESMAAKTPVLGANACSIPELIADKKTGLLSEIEEKQIAEKLEFLINNEKETRDMVEQAYQKVTKKYSWSRIIDDLEKIYEDCL